MNNGGYISPTTHASTDPASIASGVLAPNSVSSGNIASGQVGWPHLSANAVQSGQIASGAIRGTIQVLIDGGGSDLTTGIAAYVEVPGPFTVDTVTLLASSGGQAFIGLWKDTYANFPPTSGDTIATSGVPIVSGGQKNQYTGASLSGWTLTFAQGDILGVNVHSVSGIQKLTVGLQGA